MEASSKGVFLGVASGIHESLNATGLYQLEKFISALGTLPAVILNSDNGAVFFSLTCVKMKRVGDNEVCKHICVVMLGCLSGTLCGIVAVFCPEQGQQTTARGPDPARDVSLSGPPMV